MQKKLIKFGLIALIAVGLTAAIGCGDKPSAKNDTKRNDKGGTDHGGWWCDQHGLPEEECSMCDDKVYKAFKEKGDICPNHTDRAKSQCFICNPDLWPKSAARYKAKEGKDAPWPKDNAPPKK
jgi:hypothetical protein